jgi:hypothetical protein
MSDYEKDGRICLTMVHFPAKDTIDRILDQIIRPLRDIDPKQYYYEAGSLHMTINNVRVIASPENFSSLDIEKLKTLRFSHSAFSFRLQGILLSPGSVSIKGYPDQATSDFIIDLRNELNRIGVPDDKKYVEQDIAIANISICRFYSPPSEKFIKAVHEISDIDLGTIPIKEFNLVSCNGVCKHKKILHTFRL